MSDSICDAAAPTATGLLSTMMEPSACLYSAAIAMRCRRGLQHRNAGVSPGSTRRDEPQRSCGDNPTGPSHFWLVDQATVNLSPRVTALSTRNFPGLRENRGENNGNA